MPSSVLRRRRSIRSVLGGLLLLAALAPSVASAADPATGPWAVARIDATVADLPLTGVSCPAGTTLCVAVGVPRTAGRNVFFTTAADEPNSWIGNQAAPSAAFTGVSCPTAAFCAAVDTVGNVVTSTTPTAQGPWTVLQIADTRRLNAISCASSALCVAVDDLGYVSASRNPLGTPASGGTPAQPAAWAAPARVAGERKLLAVTCPTEELCLVSDEFGEVYSSTTPSVPSSYEPQFPRVAPSGAIGGLSCASATLCAAANASGMTAATTAPGPRASWSAPFPTGPVAFTAASCAVGFCAATDARGGIAVSATPTEGASWVHRVVDGITPLNAISCASPERCVAVDAVGNTIVAYAARSTTTSVVCAPATVLEGSPTTCTATVADADADPAPASTPTGIVTFASAAGSVSAVSCPLAAAAAANTATCQVTFTPRAPGASVLTGTYGGDLRHATSTGTRTVTTTAKPVPPTPPAPPAPPAPAPPTPPAPPVPPAPPAPSNAFTATNRGSAATGAQTLRVKVPGPGTIRVLASSSAAQVAAAGSRTADGIRRLTIGRATGASTRAQTVRLVVKPGKAALALLRRKGRLGGAIEVTFTPTGGVARTRTLRVTLRLTR